MTTDRDPTKLTVQDWVADLDAADAEIEAGLSVPGEEVQAKLRAVLARMRPEPRPTVPHRSVRSR